MNSIDFKSWTSTIKFRPAIPEKGLGFWFCRCSNRKSCGSASPIGTRELALDQAVDSWGRPTNWCPWCKLQFQAWHSFNVKLQWSASSVGRHGWPSYQFPRGLSRYHRLRLGVVDTLPFIVLVHSNWHVVHKKSASRLCSILDMLIERKINLLFYVTIALVGLALNHLEGDQIWNK